MNLEDHKGEIIAHLAQGLSRRETAKRLGLSRSGVTDAVTRWGLDDIYPKAVNGYSAPPTDDTTPAAAPETPDEKLVRQLDAKDRELRAVRTELRSAQTEMDLEGRILGRIQDALEMAPPRRVLQPPPPVTGRPVNEALLLASDFHFGEVVDPEQALGLEYNVEIALKRLESLTSQAIGRALNDGIDVVHIAYLGDLFSGDIHDELVVTNAMPTVDLLPILAYAIHDMCLAFVEAGIEPRAVFIPGNHGRMTKKMRSKGRYVGWDYLVGKFVEALAGDTYMVEVPKDIVVIREIAGSRVAMVHGDGIQSASWGGIPWYSMRNRREAIQSLLRALGVPQVNYLMMGHFHQHMYWQGADVDVIVNGALKGGDEYSMTSRLNVTPPVQVMMPFDAETGVSDVWLLRFT